MLQKNTLGVILAFGLLITAGFGCAKPSGSIPRTGSNATTTITGPRELSLEGLNPHDAARKIIFTSGSNFVVRESFTESGKNIAETIGYGPSAERTVVIRSFAPTNKATIEWKADTKTSKAKYQYVGVLSDANLREGHTMYPPLYWRQGEFVSNGTSGLWLSQDVYEDLAKVSVSTLKFGIEDGELLGFASSSPALRDLIRRVQAEMVKASARDLFLTTSTVGTRTLIVNGATTTVEVLNAKNWFGEIQILHNSQNPLVLRVHLAKLGGVDLGGLFDYDITELSGLQD